MEEALQRKVSLLASNTRVLQKSAKLTMSPICSLGALIFTTENLAANERNIRSARKILKKKAGIFSNARGAMNLALIARMCLKPNPEAYLEKTLFAYDQLKHGCVFAGEGLVMAAMNMAEDLPVDRFGSIAERSWETYKKMRSAHPLLTTQNDFTLAYMLTKSGVDADALLDEAEQIYAKLKPTGFKLKKNTLQQVSLVLALSDTPVDQKCARFDELRQAMKAVKQRIYGEELAVLASLVDIDTPAHELAAEIAEACEELKHHRGFGPLTCGANLRRLFASTIVMQTHIESNISSSENAVATAVVYELVMTIIMAIVITSVAASSAAAASSAS